jgi:malonate decarboxylase holo-[acyl-carrier-protein] synthase
MAEMFARHTMVHPTPAAWSALMTARTDLASDPLLMNWLQAGYPLVVRRPAHGDAADMVPLGLPLPPAQGKRRIAVTLPPDGVAHASPPPLLAHALTVAPPGWRACLDRLIDLDPLTRTFGSLAWQFLTGLPYLTGGSDLDLLWQPASRNVDRLLAGLAEIARTAPMRIDGEIICAAGGVHWRELQEHETQEVLVKGPRENRLMERATFLAGGTG